jgi:lactate 2-monooxygenase
MPDMDFGGYQNEIYLAGMAGTAPSLPVSMARLEEKASETMSPQARDYVAGGAGAEDTMRANLDAFRRWRLVPRMLRDIASRDLSTTVLGASLPAPVLLAPVGVLGIVHPEGEVAVARAASSLGVPVVLSTAASRSIEEVAEASGDGPRWFQLYWPADEKITASFLSRAEAAGYTAIVLTVDTDFLGWRPRDLGRAYLPFLHGEGIAHFTTDPVFTTGLDHPPDEDPTAAVLAWVRQQERSGRTWDDIPALREQTSLPIVVKGILHPDDARRAVEAGLNGVVVSNHGGRQVDGAIGALDALPGVVDAVAGEVPVLFDSGIRTGADAIKALGLGANAVLLGRPYVWGLALAGEEGVRHAVRSFLADLDITLGLMGLRLPTELDRSVLAPA